MIYFAYGSNMLERRLRDASRAPSAVFQATAVSSGRRLSFDKRGLDGSGKCNLTATPSEDARAFGVLFEIDKKDGPALDVAEDTRRGGYARRTIVVERLDLAQQVEAQTYLANEDFVDDALVPFDWYHALVVAGALEHSLPSPYLTELRAVPTVRDPDPQRRESGLSLLGEWRAQFD